MRIPLGVITALLAVFMGAETRAGGLDRLSFLLGSQQLGATEHFEEFNPGVFADWLRPDGIGLSLGA